MASKAITSCAISMGIPLLHLYMEPFYPAHSCFIIISILLYIYILFPELSSHNVYLFSSVFFFFLLYLTAWKTDKIRMLYSTTSVWGIQWTILPGEFLTVYLIPILGFWQGISKFCFNRFNNHKKQDITWGPLAHQPRDPVCQASLRFHAHMDLRLNCNRTSCTYRLNTLQCAPHTRKWLLHINGLVIFNMETSSKDPKC